jgi:hypothetical protein
MARWVGLGLLLGAGIGAGLGGAAWAQGPATFDGQYVGELRLTRTVDGDCTSPPLGSMYPLTISRGEVRFAYVPRFATTLVGRVGADGSFKAIARLKNGAVQMTGRVQGNTLTADIISPSCNYSFQTRG